MAELHNKFKTFDSTITLEDEAETLREKRDIILKALRKGLDRDFKARGETPPQFRSFNQGSYSLSTGVVPLDGDYDIDVGIVYDINKNDYPDAKAIDPKKWTHDALEGHTNNIQIRRSCVTVFYKAGYHVDLAVYADKDMRTDFELPLSKGKEHSGTDFKGWETNHPRRLRPLFTERYPDKQERSQVRRVIRYLKRWRDFQYQGQKGNAAPVGIGLTLLALDTTKFAYKNALTRQDDDAYALHHFVDNLLLSFHYTYHEPSGGHGDRIEAAPSYAPYNDVFQRMTNKQMATFKAKLASLKADLVLARDPNTGEKKACELMQRQFGPEFPAGKDPEDTKNSQRTPRAVFSSGDQGA